MASTPFNKLAAKYFGPFPIEAKVGAIVYRLLLADALLHHTFDISQLKRCLEVSHVINHPTVLHLSRIVLYLKFFLIEHWLRGEIKLYVKFLSSRLALKLLRPPRNIFLICNTNFPRFTLEDKSAFLQGYCCKI